MADKKSTEKKNLSYKVIDTGRTLSLFGENSSKIVPENIVNEIIDLINQDIDNNCFNKIDHVRVDVETALRLFKSGFIKPCQIRRAECDAQPEQKIYGCDTITFKNILFHTNKGYKTFKIVVYEDADSETATIDKNGKIV